MTAVMVTPRSRSPHPHDAMTPSVLAFCAALPSPPPFTGGHEWSHLDPLLRGAEAEGPTDEDEVGYDFAFVDTPDPDLVCVICSLVCRDAVETSCSHIFCERCLGRWLHQKGECATCRAPLGSSSDVHASGFLRRKVLGMRVQCVNSVACEWSGEMRYMSKHLREECALQRLIQATRAFVEVTPPQNAHLHSQESADAESDRSVSLAAVSLAFPPAILHDLPVSAVHRVASFHVRHALVAGETHSSFDLTTSRVIQMCRDEDAQPFLGVRHVRCNSGCVHPPPIDGWPTQAGGVSHPVVEFLYTTLATQRDDFTARYLALRRFLHASPVRTLRAFLSSKSVGPRLWQSGLEKHDLVELCIDHRHDCDDDAQAAHQQQGHRAKEAAYSSPRQPPPHAHGTFHASAGSGIFPFAGLGLDHVTVNGVRWEIPPGGGGGGITYSVHTNVPGHVDLAQIMRQTEAASAAAFANATAAHQQAHQQPASPEATREARERAAREIAAQVSHREAHLRRRQPAAEREMPPANVCCAIM